MILLGLWGKKFICLHAIKTHCWSCYLKFYFSKFNFNINNLKFFLLIFIPLKSTINFTFSKFSFHHNTPRCYYLKFYFSKFNSYANWASNIESLGFALKISHVLKTKKKLESFLEIVSHDHYWNILKYGLLVD